jgi:hypothetical protein
MFLLKADSVTNLHGITTQKAKAELVSVEIFFIVTEVTIFLDMAPHIFVGCHRSFRGTSSVSLQD